MHACRIRQTCKKSRFRDRWSQPHGHFWCHILVSWDLFFGQCHFWSLKTVDLATILGKHNQNWQVLVFLTVLCIVLGFVAKLCRESRCFGVKFYVANHAVLVPHFDPPKMRSCHKTTFLQVCCTSINMRAVNMIGRKFLKTDLDFSQWEEWHIS